MASMAVVNARASTLQTFGEDDYEGSVSAIRLSYQSPRRARGKFKGNKARPRETDIVRAKRSTVKRSTVRLTNSEINVVLDLQAKRVALLTKAGNNSESD